MKIDTLLLAVVLSLIPVILWGIIIRRKKREGMMKRFFLVFAMAGAGAGLIFNHQEFIENYLNQIGLPFFLVFVVAGILIEYFKNITVRIGGIKYFKNVDDVMDMSFASALGFTFVENILMFYIAFKGENPEIIGPIKMLKYFLTREFFILPIHLFCSGIFGYYYAIGLFAAPKLKKEHSKTWGYLFLHLYAKIFFVSDENAYKFVKIMQGTIISVFFYSLFFAILQKDPMFSDVFALINISLPFDEHLMPLIAFMFFKVGSVILFNLMDRKKRYVYRDLILTK